MQLIKTKEDIQKPGLTASSICQSPITGGTLIITLKKYVFLPNGKKVYKTNVSEPCRLLSSLNNEWGSKQWQMVD